MTEIERLKKLLAECINEPEKTCPMPEATTCDGCKYDMVHGECDILGRYADHLLANGVISPPAKIGDKVYVIPSQENYNLNLLHNFQEHNRVYVQPIDHIAIWKDDYMLYTCDGLQAVRGKAYKDTWFLSKEEAENALAERSKP